MAVTPPTIIQRPAHPNNYSRGRYGGRNGQHTFHHVVGSAESAVLVFQNPARQASSTYIVSAIPGVVYQSVSINDTSWADGNAASNARVITVEHHGDWRNGYRNETVIENAARLVAWLRDQGLVDHYYRHRQLTATSCPADLPVEEIWARADAILAEGTSAQAGDVSRVAWKKLPRPTEYRVNKDTSLWDFGGDSWQMPSVKKFSKGDVVTIFGSGTNLSLDAEYLVTEYSFKNKITNGFNHADLDEVKAAAPTADLVWSKLDKPATYVLTKDATLWDFDQTSFAGFGGGVKQFSKGDRVEVYGKVYNKTLDATYLVTEYSYEKRVTNGFNEKDLDVYVPPKPAPEKPEWERNLDAIEPVKLFVLDKQTPIVNLVDGSTIKQLGAGTAVDFVAATTVDGKEYLLSSWSVENGAGQGILRTAVGTPVDPPTQEKPSWLDAWQDIEDVDMYARADTDLVNLENGDTVKVIDRGTRIRVASTTEWFGHKYAITEYSTEKKEGRGIRIDDLDLDPVADEPVAPAEDQEQISWLVEATKKILDKLGIDR